MNALAGGSASGPASGARILVVEDEGLSALSIKNCLEDMGYSVPCVAATGPEAIAKAADTEPDLVIMDVRLKGAMDGIEAAGLIRKAFRIPIIYLTAFADDDTLERAKATMPYAFVVKPLDERALGAAIKMSLHKASLEREFRETKERLETILRCAGDGIVVAGANGMVSFLNPAALRLLGRPGAVPGDLSLSSLFRLSDGATGERALLPLQRVVMDGETVPMIDFTLERLDGTRLAVDLDLAPLRDGYDALQGVVIAFRDSSERRRAREQADTELRAAAELQRSLLPASGSALGRVEMRAFLRPRAFGAGDAYAFFPIDEELAGFYILDVIGQGTSASAISVLLHRMLVPDALGRLPMLDADSRRPAEVVERLNELFLADADRCFFSICYGVMDVATGKGRLVRAGQRPPVLQAAEGSLRELTRGGIAVGVMPDAAVEEEEFALDDGGRIYLYSDGLVDCVDERRSEFSKERVLSLVRRSRGADLELAVAGIEASLVQWRSRDWFDDDAALMALQFGQ
jgi:PAS domain S-box-containing protein